MSDGATLGLLAVVLLVVLAGAAVLLADREQRRVAQRRSTPVLRSDRVPPWRRHLHAAVMATPAGRSVDLRLRRAGHGRLLAGDVLLAAGAAALGVGLLASRLVAPVAAVLLGCAVLLVADRQLDRLVRTRAERFAELLPDIARTLANAAGAGMAVPNALALTAREVEEPAGSLLAEAVRQMAVGRSLAEAMAAVQEEAPSREVALLVTTLVIQQRSGGDLIGALRDMSDNLRARRDLRREVDTTMAGVRYSAYAVMGLGVAMLLVIEVISRGTLRQMTGTLAGQAVLVVAAVLYVAGSAALRRLTKVDV